MYFSDLHVQLLAKGILNPGEQLVGQTVTTYMPGWAFGLIRRTYLVLALNSGDGRDAKASIVYAVIGGTDYLDGMAARVTGQYSRLGVLLDPVVDRLLVISGVIVCWHFELLPRWALALLVAREVAMLLLAWYGLRHGVEIAVNWPGRISVFPIMGGIFFALAFAGWVPAALLIVGVALAILATVLYARTGRRTVRERGAQVRSQAP